MQNIKYDGEILIYSRNNSNLAAHLNRILMNKMPFISVIIPVYNTAQYLKDAVGSIMNQTIHDIEIIVVNDGSTDDSERIIHELMSNDERIQYYALPNNQGQSVARNEALKYAEGEYIYFMDSDDILLPNALEKCYELCKRKELQVLFFDGDIFCDEGQPALLWDYHRTERYNDNLIYIGENLFNDMLENYTHRAVPWLMLISRTHLEKLNLKFYPSIIHEDELFTTLLYLQSTSVGCLKQSLVKHRVRSNSTMTTRYSIRNVRCYLTVIDDLFTFAKANGHKKLIKKYARYTLNPVFQTAKVLPVKEKYEALRLCVQKGYLQYLSIRTLLKFLFK